MCRHLAARLAQSIVVVFIATTICFVAIRLAPGDPFSYDSTTIPPAVREFWRHERGFDRPMAEQYVRYIAGIPRGDFGYSYTRRRPVLELFAEAVPRTLLLTGLALSLSFVLGGVAGVMQASRRGGWFDRISSGTLLFFYSIPDFWAAMILLLMFASWWRIFPAGGVVNPLHDYMPPGQALSDRLSHLVLPVASLTLITMAGIARYQRAAMLEVLPSDFIRTARAKGLPERQIIWRHALRSALTPMVVLFGLVLPAFLGGALFVEAVFSWQGIGSLAAEAISTRDYDVVSATVIVGSVMVVVGNLIADALQMALDPRVR